MKELEKDLDEVLAVSDKRSYYVYVCMHACMYIMIRRSCLHCKIDEYSISLVPFFPNKSLITDIKVSSKD